MHWSDILRRALDALRLVGRGSTKPATGLVAAVVVFDREDLSKHSWGLSDQEDILSRLRGVVEQGAQGKFDGADWSPEKIKWYFFGEDAGRIESVLVEALRSEPLCKGAMLRVTRNGIAGPWRETRI